MKKNLLFTIALLAICFSSLNFAANGPSPKRAALIRKPAPAPAPAPVAAPKPKRPALSRKPVPISKASSSVVPALGHASAFALVQSRLKHKPSSAPTPAPKAESKHAAPAPKKAAAYDPNDDYTLYQFNSKYGIDTSSSRCDMSDTSRHKDN